MSVGTFFWLILFHNMYFLKISTDNVLCCQEPWFLSIFKLNVPKDLHSSKLNKRVYDKRYDLSLPISYLPFWNHNLSLSSYIVYMSYILITFPDFNYSRMVWNEVGEYYFHYEDYIYKIIPVQRSDNSGISHLFFCVVVVHTAN